MRRTVARIVAAVAILVVAGCNGGGPALDGEWVLVGVESATGDVPLLAGEPERMTIDGERIGGGTGCNSFGGTASFSGDESAGEVNLAEVGVTEMACLEPGRMEFEARFTDILFGIDSYLADGDMLTLSGPSGQLRYQVANDAIVPDASLTESEWVLHTIFSGSGSTGTATSPNASLGPATLRVSADADGQSVMFTSDDCGEFAIPLVIDDIATSAGSISTPPNVRLAAPQCDDPASNLIAAHAGVLGADRWVIEGNRLTFTIDGDPTVAFTTG